jgi:GntR family transcriptional repressor for pyruvate dehydrogenase complex
VPRQTLSDGLTQRILDLIRNEDLGPGERLPSIRALAQRFSVATPTIREALRRLQASGVVELRHGSGIYVRNGRERVVVANLDHSELDSGTVLDLLEARLMIEPRLAGLAASNAAEHELHELARRLDEAEQHLDGGDDQALQSANMSFHRGVAECSGNSILSQVVQSLVDLYSFEQLAIQMIYDDRRSDHREHRVILEAIKNRDAKKAEREMHKHLQGVRRVIEDRLATGQDKQKEVSGSK